MCEGKTIAKPSCDVMVQCEGKNIENLLHTMRKNLGISLVEKLILIFLIFFTSLGENIFCPDSGASLAPSLIAASLGSELVRRLARLGTGSPTRSARGGPFRQLESRLVRLVVAFRLLELVRRLVRLVADLFRLLNRRLVRLGSCSTASGWSKPS